MSEVFSAQLNFLIESGKLGFWQSFFEEERKKEYFASLENFLNGEYEKGVIFPSLENIFSAFTLCGGENIKVIIVGQDPYHEENQAMGLAFSVEKTQKVPPSLRNIFKELQDDIGVVRKSGDISDLAKKGVFLINTVLTVQKGKANSHAKMGWEIFTQSAVSHVCKNNPGVILLLFGKPAEKFQNVATRETQIIKTAHPSPLSAYRGFFGSKIFSQMNEILQSRGEKIDWNEEKSESENCEHFQTSFL